MQLHQLITLLIFDWIHKKRTNWEKYQIVNIVSTLHCLCHLHYTEFRFDVHFIANSNLLVYRKPFASNVWLIIIIIIWENFWFFHYIWLSSKKKSSFSRVILPKAAQSICSIQFYLFFQFKIPTKKTHQKILIKNKSQSVYVAIFKTKNIYGSHGSFAMSE